jgi:hypothetical protein
MQGGHTDGTREIVHRVVTEPPAVAGVAEMAGWPDGQFRVIRASSRIREAQPQEQTAAHGHGGSISRSQMRKVR